jgi:lysophospholipase L1-like esterase
MSQLSCDAGRAKQIVCFGDSVTQGVPHVAPEDTFVALLERRLNQRSGTEMQICATNAGVGGENTAEGLVRLDADVLAHEPDLVTVEFGLNDIRYEPEKRIPEETFAANLREMHRRLDAAGAIVIFMTPNPIIDVFHVYSQGTDYYAPWGGCNGLNAIYAGIIRQVAADVQAPLCDIYSALVKEAVKSEFHGETFDYGDLSILGRYISTQDGVHPTAAGQEFIAAELYAVIAAGDLLASHVSPVI